MGKMIKFKGKGVYGAIGIGKASLLNKDTVEIEKRQIESIEKELTRVDKAKLSAKNQLTKIYNKALSEVGETGAQIFDIHIMMLDDEDYNESIENIIRNQRVNAEYAVYVTSENFQKMFSSMNDSYMRARASDIKDISDRIIACLENKQSATTLSCKSQIICARDLAPS